MIGSVGGNPLASQLQAYSGVKPGETGQANPNEKLKPASESEEASSGTLRADASERAYDSGGVSAGSDQRGGTLDISV